MGIAKEKDRIEPVLQFFAKLKDSATKIEAIGLVDDRIVRMVPDEAASKVLGNLLKDADLKVRVRAAHALGRCGKGGDHFDALAALIKETDARGTCDVLYCMGAARDKRFVPIIKAHRKHADPDVRAKAAFYLRNYPNEDIPGTMALLISNAECKEVEARRNAVRAMGQFGDRSFLPALEKALKDEDPMVRLLTLEALVKLSEEKAKEAARVLAEDPSPLVRRTVIEAMITLGARGYVPQIVKLLDDSDDLVRWMAIGAVGRLGDRSILPELRKRLKDAEEEWKARMEDSIRAIETRFPG